MSLMKGLASLVRKPLRSQPPGVKAAARQLLSELRLARAARGSCRQFAALQGRSGLKVHLGCGPDIRRGWVNVDLFPGEPPRVDPSWVDDTMLIVHDLRRGLPLAPGSCDFVYSSHFFEHLTFSDGLRLMKDCHAALRPGGTFRIVLPDFRQDFDAYMRQDRAFFQPLDRYGLMDLFEPEFRTFVDYVNYCVYQHGEHVTIYDEEKVMRMLTVLGFTGVVHSQYTPGMDPDSELRRRYSFYVEATK